MSILTLDSDGTPVLPFIHNEKVTGIVLLPNLCSLW